MKKNSLFVFCLILLSPLSSNAQNLLEYTDCIGGEMRDLEIYSQEGKTYAYVAQGGALIVYETTDPYHPIERHRIHPAPGKIYDLALGDRFLAVAMGQHGTLIYSLDDPVHLHLASTIEVYSKEVQASGYALVIKNSFRGPSPASSSYPLWIYSLYDRVHPTQIYTHSYSGYHTFEIPSYYTIDSIQTTDDSVLYYSRLTQILPNGYAGFYRVRVHQDSYEESPFPISIPDYTTISPNLCKMSFHDHLALGGYRIGDFQDYRLKIFDITTDNFLLLYDCPMTVDGKMLFDTNTAYIKSATEYCILDLSDTQNIQIQGRVSFPYDPIAIVDKVAYAIDSKEQLVLQVINGENALVASKTPSCLGHVFSLATGGDTLYSSEHNTTGEVPISHIHILNGELELTQPHSSITVEGYFPFLYAQPGWLLVDNSTKLRLYNIQDSSHPLLVWEIDPDYSFPTIYNKEPSFAKEYDLLFHFPYLILSYDQTLLVYEIKDHSSVIEIVRKPLDWRFTALDYHHGLLYGIKSAIGLAIFNLTEPGTPLIYEDETLLEDSISMRFGQIAWINEDLLLLNYHEWHYSMYRYDAHDDEFLLRYDKSYEKFLPKQPYQIIANDTNLYVMTCRGLDYSFNSESREQMLYQVSFDDPTAPQIIQHFSLPPTLEPPLRLHGDSLLIPAREVGILRFQLPSAGVSVSDWMLHIDP